MKKKYVIIAVISLVILVGFYGYRHFKKKDELEKHHEKTNSMILQIAKNDPFGGMTEMGMALNRYAADHQAYPESLQQLYPKYIYSKTFLDEIEWDYKLRADDFYLSKTITHQNKRLVTYIDKTLRSNLDKTIMVSSAADVSKKVKEATEKGAPTKSLSKDVDWHKRAVALWKNTKYTDPKKALGYLNQAIGTNQNDAKVYNDRGIAKMNLAQYEQAINDYKQAVRLKPNFTGAFFNQGLVNYELDKIDSMCNNFKKSCELGNCKGSKWANKKGLCK